MSGNLKHSSSTSTELLGFPPDARVLIVNNDDLGMYHAINAAIIHSVEEGIASSCSLMVPCPWALNAMRLLLVGLSEWAVHLGLGNAESQAIDGGWRVRRTDYEFLISPEARELVREEQIHLIDYRTFQQAWSASGHTTQ
jgi:predicted glycoside hydrolase/deacetylase ChbG (UPF0249 family)